MFAALVGLHNNNAAERLFIAGFSKKILKNFFGRFSKNKTADFSFRRFAVLIIGFLFKINNGARSCVDFIFIFKSGIFEFYLINNSGIEAELNLDF